MSVPEQRFPRKWLIRIAGSVVVLGATLLALPTREVFSAMGDVPLATWLLSLVAFSLGHVVSSFKWRALVGGSKIPASRALLAHFAGLTANLCLPGAAGGDVVRAGLVLRDAPDKALVAVGSLADRVLDTFGLLILAACGAAITLGGEGGVLPLLLELGGALVVLVALAFLAGAVLPRLPLKGKLKGLVDALMTSAAGLRRRPGALAACLLLSMSVQSVFIGVNVILAVQSGLLLPAAAWFFAWPLAKLLAMVPISIGGLGVREASLAALLAPLGAPASRVVAVGLLWQSILFASGLIGGATLLLLNGRRASGKGPTLGVPDAPDDVPPVPLPIAPIAPIASNHSEKTRS
jgi:uncharacterized membrane protein YbhN (UPF0104 family)